MTGPLPEPAILAAGAVKGTLGAMLLGLRMGLRMVAVSLFAA